MVVKQLLKKYLRCYEDAVKFWLTLLWELRAYKSTYTVRTQSLDIWIIKLVSVKTKHVRTCNKNNTEKLYRLTSH